jgi:hypothetical protein
MGGGRALFGVLLGIAIVAAAIYAGSRWLPEPEKDIEWVHSPESIIVQMKTSGGDDPITGFLSGLRPAPFTLYGDGTLIASEAADDCSLSGACQSVLESHLSEVEVRDLLVFIEDTGFFDFYYEQPQPPINGAPTTRIFAAVKDRQNAVTANALHYPNLEGAEWHQFRKLAEIRVRLSEVQEQILANTLHYRPAEGKISVLREASPVEGTVPEWSFAQVDISAATEIVMSADRLQELQISDVSTTYCWCPVQHNGRVYNVYYRPVLPYEENFPEFEPPQ